MSKSKIIKIDTQNKITNDKSNNINKPTKTKYIDTNPECRICGDNLEDNDIEILKCGHTFHYDCVIYAFNCPTSRSRECPYCRKHHGYLRLLPNMKPIKGIHKEYTNPKKETKKKIKKIVDSIDIPKVTKNTIILCKGKYKTGIKAGEPCSAPAKPGKNGYCGRHKINI